MHIVEISLERCLTNISFRCSIRAYRGLRFNEAYAARLEAKRVRRKEKQAAKDKAKADAEIKSQAAKVNPFSVSFDIKFFQYF